VASVDLKHRERHLRLGITCEKEETDEFTCTVSGWWAPLREAMWRFAGVDAEYLDFGKASPISTDIEAMKPIVDSTTVVNISPETQNHLPMPEKVIITYIDRQI
jgi:hypothetical protein